MRTRKIFFPNKNSPETPSSFIFPPPPHPSRLRADPRIMDTAGAALGSNNQSSCFYSLLGLRRCASASEIRSAYRKLALKWHPDRWARDPAAAGEAKRRFQRIQEAYSVLSDEGKRAMYDVGLYDPLDDDEDDISDFMKDFMVAVERANSEPPSTFEEIQDMFNDMVNQMRMDNGFFGSNRMV